MYDIHCLNHCRTKKYGLDSLSYNGAHATIWDLLPNDMKECKDLGIFKASVINWNEPMCKYRMCSNNCFLFHKLKGHCIEFKYYADGIHSGLTPPGNNSSPAGVTKAEVSPSLFTPLSHHYRRVYSHHTKFYTVPL